MTDKLYTYEYLFHFARNIFLKIGCSEADATLATKVLLSADARGIDSHGIARLTGYIRLWEVKRINPICVAVPAGSEPPFVADLATTTAANGKLEILQRKKGKAPAGWIQDKEGHPSTDPHELKTGGALLPLGGDREHGSHKGYALGAIVDIFSAILSGANYGPWVPPFPAYVPLPDEQPGKGIGHFLGAMRIDAFRPADEFKKNMDKWIQRFRGAKTVEWQK